MTTSKPKFGKDLDALFAEIQQRLDKLDEREQYRSSKLPDNPALHAMIALLAERDYSASELVKKLKKNQEFKKLKNKRRSGGRGLRDSSDFKSAGNKEANYKSSLTASSTRSNSALLD